MTAGSSIKYTHPASDASDFDIFDVGSAKLITRAPTVGVTASGNCEILVEPADAPDTCRVSVNTSAIGFGAIWQAVLGDFGRRHAAGGLAIEINDVGATPAVVSLRLDQAIEAWEEDHA